MADKWAARKLLNADVVLHYAKATLGVRELFANLDVMPCALETFVSLLNECEIYWILRKARENS